MKPSDTETISAYRAAVSQMIGHPKVQEMDSYIQHGKTTCLSHCVYVSWTSWRLARFLNVFPDEVARGALLHDLFLYDWHVTKLPGLHAFTHPKRALSNAEEYFELTPREKDIISHHMWPVTPALPKYASTLIVIFADKYCAVLDTFGMSRRFRSLIKALLEREL